MKISLYKRIIPGILIVTIIFPFAGLSFPQKARAQAAVIDAGNIVQSTVTASNTTGSVFANLQLNFKEYVLDGLASMLVKQIIRQLTASVVNWINSGFQGSPSFMTNPGAFFLDMADQITGDFLAKAGGPLTALCSPFSIDIRIALAFKYHPNIQKRYTCTLGAIIKNSVAAAKGATLNGFSAGDFKQGGWPAFVSMTTEPQNNVYGSFLTADSELSLRVANAQIQQKDELNQGKGFLSWRNSKCVNSVKSHNDGVNAAYAENFNKTNTDFTPSSGTPTSGDEFGNDVTPGADYGASNPVSEPAPYSPGGNAPAGGDAKQPTLLKKDDCPIDTPGSVIVSSLEDNLKGPLHELQLADEFNEIVNALFAQLVTQVLSKGLGAVSGSGASDSKSYINQIQQEAKNDTTNLPTLRNEFITNVETYISNTLQYKNNKDQALNLMLGVQNDFNAVKACYDNKIKNSQPPLSAFDANRAEAKKTEVDSILNTSVAPLATKLLTDAQSADKRYAALLDLKARGNAAKTVNDLNGPSQEYSAMLSNQTLVSAKDISDSQQELAQTQTSADTFKQDALRRNQECQIFPNSSQLRGVAP